MPIVQFEPLPTFPLFFQPFLNFNMSLTNTLLRLFISFLRVSFYRQSIYRLDFWTGILSTIIMMYALHSLWRALYLAMPNAFGMSINQMTTYGALSIVLATMMEPTTQVQYYIAQQIRQGTIELEIIKPIGFVTLMLCRNSSEFLVQFVLKGFPSIVFGIIVLGISLPSIMTTIKFAISLTFAYLIYFCINFLIGTLSILTMDIRSYGWAIAALIRFTSGQFVPLWMFPAALAIMIRFLPFQGIYFAPLSIYTSPDTYIYVLVEQAAWTAVLLVVSLLAWRKIVKRVDIQGG